MPECRAVRENLPFLLTESLEPATREATHLHVESCSDCSAEWEALRSTWALLGEVPDVPVPPRVRQSFLDEIAPATASNVVPFHRRPSVRWLSQAAAVVLIAGGAYFAGHRTAPVRLESQPATVAAVQPLTQPIYSIAESRVLPARSVSPDIEGRPDIQNVQFVGATKDGQIGMSFDITSHVTVNGSPQDMSMVRLLSYVLQSEDHASPARSRAIDWVRQTYSSPSSANPEIAQALAKVLRNDQHEGVRLKAVETLKSFPPRVTGAGDTTRDALISALKSDPNPAVRIKAVEALARMASNGQQLQPDEVDTLRQKAAQDDENLYIRVKAAEALSKIRP